MKWFTREIEYDGYPLLLRKPEHGNIWQYKERMGQLACVEHSLETVTSKGLPEKDYNNSLLDFDNYMCSLFDNNKQGIIFLVETFGGKRNYYYFTERNYDFDRHIKYAKEIFQTSLSLTTRLDEDWGFFKVYPIDLY